MKNIAVLVSGGGTNLQALIDVDIPNGKISLVISSKADAYALTRAENNNIKTAVVEWTDFKPSRKDFSMEILNLLREHEIDLVIYAGFMVILDECVVKAFPNKMINVHPSLLPSFGGEGFYGLKVHEAALNRGVKLSGATVHFVNEICDGGEIILQKAAEVKDSDTPETLQARIMEVEREILPKAVKLLIERASKFENK
ncbi:MAG: phosphoribosylglycinamide formyltransferase [Oscillospiraceae bacterium]|jgi:phosphoribosylglycinamide formyltransferase-1|nr:phosphoribosylglycinamide formyltransferase [Oscillospiraceae bacterium]